MDMQALHKHIAYVCHTHTHLHTQLHTLPATDTSTQYVEH